jgi:hypothetical protein
MNFIVLVICALLGLCTRLLIGFDPWKLLGSLSLVILVLPIFNISLQHDPQITQAMANDYTTHLITQLPSMLIGEIAGVFAKEIFSVTKGIVGVIPNLNSKQEVILGSKTEVNYLD